MCLCHEPRQRISIPKRRQNLCQTSFSWQRDLAVKISSLQVKISDVSLYVNILCSFKNRTLRVTEMIFAKMFVCMHRSSCECRFKPFERHQCQLIQLGLMRERVSISQTRFTGALEMRDRHGMMLRLRMQPPGLAKSPTLYCARMQML